LPSGVQSTFDNRVSWAKTYLKKAGLVATPSRGKVKITDRGLSVLRQNPSRIDQNFLKQFPEFLDFQGYKSDTQSNYEEGVATLESELTPQEILENSYQDLRNKLVHELLAQVMNSSQSSLKDWLLIFLLPWGMVDQGVRLERELEDQVTMGLMGLSRKINWDLIL